jgi:hypothetical protein
VIVADCLVLKKKYEKIDDENENEMNISAPIIPEGENYGSQDNREKRDYDANDDLRVSSGDSEDSGYSADSDGLEKESPWDSDDNVTSSDEEDDKKSVEINI